jgi:hypothetical protein
MVLRNDLRPLRCAASAAAAVAALVLAACTTIPVSSLWALRKIELMTLDPAQLRAAIRLPAGVGLQRDAVAVDLKVEHAATGETFAERLWLRARPAPGGAWPGERDTTGQWQLLALDVGDQQRLQALRARVAAWKAASTTGEARSRLSLQLSPQACRRGAGPALTDLRLTAWLHWAATPGWLPMLDDAPLSSLLPDDTPPLPACAG